MNKISKYYFDNYGLISDKIALVDETHTISYTELSNLVNNLSEKLIRFNNRRAIISMNDNINFIISILASWKAGITPIIGKAQYNQSTIKKMIAENRGALLLNDDTNHTISILTPLDFSLENVELEDNLLKDALVILPTSGTTGISKEVIVSIENAEYAYKVIKDMVTLGSKPLNELVFANITSVILFLQIIPTLKSKGTLFLLNKLNKWDSLIKWLQEIDFDYTVLTPTLLNGFLEIPFLAKQLRKIENIYIGGERMDKSILEKMKKENFFPVFYGYGMTESLGAFCVKKVENEFNNSVGKVNRYFEVKIIHNQVPCRYGEIGEIFVKGRSISNSYLYKNKIISIDEWLPTGDLGYFNENNEIVIKGRKKRIVIRSGLNIFLEDIESVVKNYPSIKYAYAMGEPDEVLGEAIRLVISVDSCKYDENDFKKYLKSHLSAYEYPQSIILKDEEYFSLNGIGKIGVNKKYE